MVTCFPQCSTELKFNAKQSYIDKTMILWWEKSFQIGRCVSEFSFRNFIAKWNVSGMNKQDHAIITLLGKNVVLECSWKLGLATGLRNLKMLNTPRKILLRRVSKIQ